MSEAERVHQEREGRCTICVENVIERSRTDPWTGEMVWSADAVMMPWPCEVAALTTRLAEAQQDLRIARADAESVKKAVVYEYERAESAEQLLSEMATVVKFETEDHPLDGLPGPCGCWQCVIMAKYDARRSEKVTEHRKCYYEANADYCAVHGKRGPHCAVCRDTWPCAEAR